MRIETSNSPNTERCLIEELNPSHQDVTIPNQDINALMSREGSVMRINLPNMIILSSPNPFLKAAMELQFAQAQQQEDFQTGIMGLVRLATYAN